MKYVLWEEQNHICLYTGKQIRISDFIGTNPKFDIEHTIPRSVGGDSTKMNLTLCDSRFNREVKKTKLPVELPNHDEIMERIKEWKKKYELLDSQIRKNKKQSKGATTKKQKDDIISKRHLLELRRDYWRGKYERFTMESVPEGFSRRQGTDISVISKYARLYLKSLFNRVYTVKGIATSDFRKIWGIQDIYSKKEREFEIVNMLQAAQYYKTSNDKEVVDRHIVPIKSEHDYPFAYTLKIGTMVLLYEKSPNEIWEATVKERNRRLYKVTGMSTSTIGNCIYARITMVYNEEARPSKDIKAKNGAYKQGEELRPAIIMLHTQLNALVQGYDFEINELGEIKRLG
mgnify:CR=1 FL=1